VKLLDKIAGWWRGSDDPAEREEAKKLQEEIETRRGSVGGAGNPFGAGGTHGRESDFRGP
jgi:hypothetical protein